MKKAGLMAALCVAGALVMPVLADGYFVSGEYTRPELPGTKYFGSHVMTAADAYHQSPGADTRSQLMEAVLQYPNEINDFMYDHGLYSPLGIAIRHNDYELVSFLLEHGVSPVFDTYGGMEKLLAPDSKVDERIVKLVRSNLNSVALKEACVKESLLPDIHPWAAGGFYTYRRELPQALGVGRAFSRLPEAAVWQSAEDGRGSHSAVVALEGLRRGRASEEGAEEESVEFLRVVLVLSNDGRLVRVEYITLPEAGAKEPLRDRIRTARYLISMVPYVFTIPRRDGKVSILSFSKKAQKVVHTLIGEDGQVESSETLCPRVPRAKAYQKVEGHTSTEGWEIPMAEWLTEE